MPNAMSKLSVAERLELCSIPEPNTGCILWTGSSWAGGYGRISIDHRHHLTHRVAWEKRFGPIPSGAVVCHKCDTRACINVDHLFLGTHKDNSVDMARKGRSLSGAKNRNCRLSADQVHEIRAALRAGRPYTEVAAAFGINQSHVYRIKSGRAWASVTELTPPDSKGGGE